MLLRMLKFVRLSLLLLLFVAPAICQWKNRPADPYFFAKPIVIPAAEGDFHHAMIESDTRRDGATSTPIFAKIGVMLLDGVFTFSGIDEEFIPLLKDGSGGKCLPFYGTNVVHKCEDEYFLLNADFVDLRKQIFNKADQLEKICEDLNTDVKRAGVTDKNHFVVRFGRRVLMTYKYDGNGRKCIGTYDAEDDQFSCIMPTEIGKTKKYELKPFRMDGFLYDPIYGTPHRDDNSVEVFCKMKHKFAK